MGGKNKADNSAVVQEQQNEAAAAAAKEAARQDRLKQGLASIKTAFEGSPVMKTTTSNFDWSSFNPGGTYDPSTGQVTPHQDGVPAGYTAVRVAPKDGGATTPATASRPAYAANPSAGQFGQPTSIPAAGGSQSGSASSNVWALKDPSGKIYYQGDAVPVAKQTATGETSGGFDDAFYNKYKQAVLDYYMPQVQDQYKNARDELTYRLARAGTLDSSAANTDVADLAKQNALNEGNVRNQADTAEGDLRTQVASEKQKAISQLYATEDPEVAANTALSSVRDISLQTPSLSPLSAIFDVASVGGANILKGYNSQQFADAYKTALAGGGGSGGRRQSIVGG